MLKMSDKRELGIITIYNAYSEDYSEEFFKRIGEAYELIREVEPRWARRIAKHCPRIIVSFGSITQFWPRTRTISLASDIARRPELALIASAMVHEAVHARLSAYGFRSWPDLEWRLERICLRHDLAFLHRLPDGQYYADHYEQFLDEARWRSVVAPSVDPAELDRIGLPLWLKRLSPRLLGRN